MSGLIFIPIPGIYHMVYIGLSLGHLIIRIIKYMKDDMKRGVKKLLQWISNI